MDPRKYGYQRKDKLFLREIKENEEREFGKEGIFFILNLV